MSSPRYGAERLAANRTALARVGMSSPDGRLLRQYLGIVRNTRTDVLFQEAFIGRAMSEYGWNFAEFVARLIARWAAENAR